MYGILAFMKKSSIVYFCIGIVCLLCVPVMAYIYLPVAFIYLIPAAIFFWLSKDVAVLIAKKIAGLVSLCLGFFVNKTKNLKEKIADGQTARKVKAEKKAAEKVTQEETVVATAAAEEPVPVDATAEELVVADETAEEPADEKATEETPSDDKATLEEPVGEQMTIDEALSEETTQEEPAAEEEAKQEEPTAEETQQEEPASEETKQEEPATEENKQEETTVEETKQEEPVDEKATKEPIDILGNVKRGFGAVINKAKNIKPVKALKSEEKDATEEILDIEKAPEADAEKASEDDAEKVSEDDAEKAPEDDAEKAPEDGAEKVPEDDVEKAPEVETGQAPDEEAVKKTGGLSSNIANLIKLRKGADAVDIEAEIRKQFDDLDMITTSAIAIMLSDTKTKAASPYIRKLKKPDVSTVLFKFCRDTFFATDIEQLNRLFSKSYYKWKITRYFGRITVFVKRGIGDSLPRRAALRKARVTKNRFINKICETINTFESVKYISALSGNEEISDSKRNYKLDHLSENYKDALIYLVDMLLTCTCISKMLFVERTIKNMDENSEFNRIITNMANSIDNHNLIISKSRPIYKQYYQAELGHISGDDLLYGMAITIMVNRVKKVDIRNTDILQISRERNTNDFKQGMVKWLDGLAKEDNVDDIGTLILQKITLSIKEDYRLLITALKELTSWENYYNQRVSYYMKERDKERYLKGDFEEEKEELIRIRQ